MHVNYLVYTTPTITSFHNGSREGFLYELVTLAALETARASACVVRPELIKTRPFRSWMCRGFEVVREGALHQHTFWKMADCGQLHI